MKTLARWAGRFGSPYPMTHRAWNVTPLAFAFTAFAVPVVSLFYVSLAFAADAAPSPDVVSSIVSLYGPVCGVIAAVVILCERIARVIPNSTTSKVLKVALVIATILGVKVPDNK